MNPSVGDTGRETRIIHTLGTSDRGWEEFIAILRAYRISRVVDVRSFPTSRFEHFKGKEMEARLKSEGIDYLWLGESLGGYRKGGYLAYTSTSLFGQGIDRLEEVAAEGDVVMVCAERFPWKCHRRFIARALEERGWRIVHIIGRDRVWEPVKNSPQSQGKLL